jgi:hypothetical protein
MTDPWSIQRDFVSLVVLLPGMLLLERDGISLFLRNSTVKVFSAPLFLFEEVETENTYW